MGMLTLTELLAFIMKYILVALRKAFSLILDEGLSWEGQGC